MINIFATESDEVSNPENYSLVYKNGQKGDNRLINLEVVKDIDKKKEKIK